MIRVRDLVPACGVVGALVLIGSPDPGRAQAGPAAGAPPPPLVDAMHLRMQPERALTGGSVRVLGDQSQPGMYVYRNRFAPGQMSHPHYHDQARYVTVIEGTWWTGEGDVFRRDQMVPIRAGGFMYHPAGLHHYDGSKEGEVIVQIMGLGPVHTTQTEVDEQGQPVRREPGGGAARPAR